MPDNSRAELHSFAVHILEAFVAGVAERHPGKPVGVGELNAAAHAIAASPAFDALVDRFHRRIVEEATRAISRKQRRNPFRRLIVHPIGAAFEAGLLTRDILPSYFNFIHLVMGDEEMKAYDEQCQAILDEHAPGEDFDWDRFYHDQRAKQILWTVLRHIAESFKRFEIRRDWLIGLMQTKRQAVSVASMAFLPIRPEEVAEERNVAFGNREFLILFECLFGPMRDLSPADHTAFFRAFGLQPEEAFGDLLAHLEHARTVG